ncbi:hypothetical protein [Mesorhizobium waimense]|uniref:hypothetical protein n=1 Tax=Mesorhizobium waimense TaxID=1300307 RepID=UPI001ABF9604|nr:hypothetical protein [Mesorhizobium waimense]
MMLTPAQLAMLIEGIDWRAPNPGPAPTLPGKPFDVSASSKPSVCWQQHPRDTQLFRGNPEIELAHCALDYVQ